MDADSFIDPRTGRAGNGAKIKNVHCVVEGWLMDIPGWSPAWHHFMLTVVHLRDVKGTPPANKLFPQATHEMLLQAMDSEAKPDPQNPDTWKFLQPANWVAQFTCPDDNTAAQACRGLAFVCLDGKLALELQGIRGSKEHWDQNLKLLLPPGSRIE
jgi:hypothetical protein